LTTEYDLTLFTVVDQATNKESNMQIQDVKIVAEWRKDHPVDDLTPYRVIKLLNVILASAGMKECPTQMGYNYAKKGYIKHTNNRVTVEDAQAFLEKYLTNKASK
jgi:hypothetical protein